MALFKVLRGDESNLPATLNDGWAYFCSDTGNFYIDWADDAGNLTRTQVNANYAGKLKYEEGGSLLDIDPREIALKEDLVQIDATLSIEGAAADAKAVSDAIAAIPQMDWEQTDETASDYIKNKPDENDAMLVAIETGLIEAVVTASGEVLTDKNGTVITL